MRRLGRILSDFLPGITVFIYKRTLALLLATCRWRVEGLTAFHAVADEKKCILAFWHDRLLLIAPLLMRFAARYRYAAVVSASREGRLLARLIASYRCGRALSVSADGHTPALRAMMRALQRYNEVLVIAPDGPKGPRHTVKGGLAFAAIHAEATVIPVSWRASHSWQWGTWDSMALPKPFSTIEVFFGQGVSFQKDTPLETSLLRLQSMMENVTYASHTE